MSKKPMTMAEFNQKYSIWANIQATKELTIQKSVTGVTVDFGQQNDPYGIEDFTVYEREGCQQEVFCYEGDNEKRFYEELIEFFNIVD